MTQSVLAPGGVQGVALTLQILELLAANKVGGVTELARKLGTSKTRTFRHLRTMVTLGYVVQDPADETYRLSIRFAHLGRAMADQFELLPASRPVMRRLRDELGHTVVLSVLEAGHLLTAEQVDGHTTLAVGVLIGSELGLHSSAQGKVALAFGPPDLLEQTLNGRLKGLNNQTITNPARLRKEIATIQQQGWATAPGETMSGVNAVAAPIVVPKTGTVAALAILGSVDLIPARPARRQIAAVVAAAQEITAILNPDRT